MTKEEKFERLFVEKCLDIALNQKGMEKKEFALAALAIGRKPKSAERMVYSLIGQTPTRSPQKLRLQDAYKIAQVLELDFARLVWLVEEGLKEV